MLGRTISRVKTGSNISFSSEINDVLSKEGLKNSLKNIVKYIENELEKNLKDMKMEIQRILNALKAEIQIGI